MYEHQGLQDVFFIMLYGSAAMMALLAAVYLVLRNGNALAPSIKSSHQLRCWAAAFLTAVAASHIWWYVLGIYWLTEDRLLRNIIAISLDRLTLVPLMMCILLRMLQDRHRSLRSIAAAMVPFAVIAVVSMVTHDKNYELYTECYSLLLCFFFLINYILALRHYGRWLRDNFADLEHKEVWQSMALFSFIFSLSSRKTPILPVYRFKPKTQTRIKPTENIIDANIAPPCPPIKNFKRRNKNDPNPMARPANIPKKSVLKNFFILEYWFIINECFYIRSTIHFKA